MGTFDADDDDYAGLATLGGPRAPASHANIDQLKEELDKTKDKMKELIAILSNHQCVLRDPWCACCAKLHKEISKWVDKS